MKLEQHKYVSVHFIPDGMEELLCEICGRRILSSGNPEYHLDILEAGDEYALHSDGKGLVEMGALHKMGEDDDTPQVFDEWAKKNLK